MQTIAIHGGRDGMPSIVQRRHDLSGLDYELLVKVDRSVAGALCDRGSCIWSDDVELGRGRPAIVLHGEESDQVDVQIRADAADPTTVIARGRMSGADAECCVEHGSAEPIEWIGRPLT